MVRAQTGEGEGVAEAGARSPRPSAQLSGVPKRLSTWPPSGSYTREAPGKEETGFPGEEKARSSRGAALPTRRKLVYRPAVEGDAAPAPGKPARVVGLGPKQGARACLSLHPQWQRGGLVSDPVSRGTSPAFRAGPPSPTASPLFSSQGCQLGGPAQPLKAAPQVRESQAKRFPWRGAGWPV